jgi:hypothetical protein
MHNNTFWRICFHESGRKMYPPPAAAAAAIRLGLSIGLAISSSATWLRFFAIRSIHHLFLACRQLVWIDGRQHRSRRVSSVSTTARIPSSSTSWDTHTLARLHFGTLPVLAVLWIPKKPPVPSLDVFQNKRTPGSVSWSVPEPENLRFLIMKCSRIRGPPVPFLEGRNSESKNSRFWLFQNLKEPGVLWSVLCSWLFEPRFYISVGPFALSENISR